MRYQTTSALAAGMFAAIAAGCAGELGSEAEVAAPARLELDFSSADVVVHAASEDVGDGWRTRLSDEDGTDYADVHVAEDGTWTGTIAGVDIGDPAVIPLSTWQASYESEVGQRLMDVSMTARSMVQDENDPQWNDFFFTIASLSSVLGNEAGAEPTAEQEAALRSSWTFVSGKYFDCSWANARQAKITASYGGRAYLGYVGSRELYWGTSAYRTVSKTSWTRKTGTVAVYHASRGRWTTAYLGCLW